MSFPWYPMTALLPSAVSSTGSRQPKIIETGSSDCKPFPWLIVSICHPCSTLLSSPGTPTHTTRVSLHNLGQLQTALNMEGSCSREVRPDSFSCLRLLSAPAFHDSSAEICTQDQAPRPAPTQFLLLLSGPYPCSNKSHKSRAAQVSSKSYI